VKTLRAAGLALLAIGMAVPVGAEDAKVLLKKVESRLYYPQENGLKDLSATIVFESGPGQAMAVQVFWKCPDKKACKVDLPEEIKNSPMAGMVQGMMEKAVSGLVSILVPLRLGSQEDSFDYTAEADGDLMKITGKRKADAKEKTLPEEMIMWVDAKATPVKMASVVNGQRSEMSELKFEEKDGKLLMSAVSVSGSAPGGPGGPGKMKPMLMKLEYAQVDSIWLVKGAKFEGQGGGGYTVKDHAVNKGIDDAVFAPKTPAGMPPKESGK